uniref:Uncharacterized protein n=1 Tax=Hyaloperonospora arabidopsidis (strain Emoy2) TaxID=559515 RepID=M4C2Q6_HYAAE
MSRSWGSLSLTLSHGTVSQAVGHQNWPRRLHRVSDTDSLVTLRQLTLLSSCCGSCRVGCSYNRYRSRWTGNTPMYVEGMSVKAERKRPVSRRLRTKK